MADEGPPRPDEELVAELEAEFEALKVADLLVQTVFGLSSLGYRSLTEEARDLDQARLAIEALRALVPALKGEIPDQTTSDFEQLVANMQLAYAAAAAKPS